MCLYYSIDSFVSMASGLDKFVVKFFSVNFLKKKNLNTFHVSSNSYLRLSNEQHMIIFDINSQKPFISQAVQQNMQNNTRLSLQLHQVQIH